MEIIEAIGKIRPIAMFMRAVYKQYVEEFDLDEEKAKGVYLTHYPVATNTERFTEEEIDYIFRPYVSI